MSAMEEILAMDTDTFSQGNTPTTVGCLRGQLKRAVECGGKRMMLDILY